MSWLSLAAMRWGKVVLAATIAVVVLGIGTLKAATFEAYPEFSPTAVQVQTEALGLSAAEVESLVTVPLEQDLLNGVPWVDHISSTSTPGLSAIEIVFQAGTNALNARQMVQERMTQIRALPNVGTPPIMVQPLASLSRVAMLGLTSTDRSTQGLVDLLLPGPVDDQVQADGRPGGGERRHLRPAGPAASGPGRPRQDE